MNNEEELMKVAVDTLQTRDDAYCSKIKGLNQQEQWIYEWYKANPNSTDQEISELSGTRLASVNGRRKSLVEKGLLKPTDKKFCGETQCWRTTYEVTEANEVVEVDLQLTTTEMNHLRRLIIKANDFQRKKIRELL